MTTIYDPPENLFKIERDSMGYYTVTRMKDGLETESRYLQFQEDVERFEYGLKQIPFLPSSKRHWAYTELINSLFE